jgi:hypothetical protein
MRIAPRVACFALVAAFAHAATPGDSAPAVWKEHHVNFFYRGRTARYSCDGLRDKVRAMLLDMGARRDLKIVTLGCTEDHRVQAYGGGAPVGVGHGASPSLSIDFSALALPEAMARTRSDAVATTRSLGGASVMPARFEAFMITSDAFRNLGVGDCELVQEFTRQILPRLVTRDVMRDIACLADQRENRFLVRGVVLKLWSQPGRPR